MIRILMLAAASFPSQAAEVTYKKDVRPVFEKRCAMCHNENWPDKNWMVYSTAKENKDKIKLRVWDQRTMPVGSDMPDSERKLIKDWVEGGAKE